jgi:protein-S-isoprenylcysteine O-methyltransferase Ste14
MALREELESQGQFLFRWRSYLPVLAIPLFIVALRQSGDFERVFGHRANALWIAFCIAVSFLGLAVRCLVAGFVPRGTSGRNTKEQRAEVLNITGMYSIVRNPLYLGNFIITFGLFLFTRAWWFIGVGTIGFLWYYERIIFTEEEFLRCQFGEAFLAWAKKTPILFPNVRLWQATSLPFSWQTLLRREHSTFFAIVASFTFLNVAVVFFTKNKFELDIRWILFFSIGLLIYLVLRILKKKTKLLNVKGR